MIYLMFVVAFISGTLSAAIDDKDCPSGNIVQYYPHETHCGLFYQCSNGQLILQQCPTGLYFDVILNVCDGNVDCQDRTTSTPKDHPTTPSIVTTTTTTKRTTTAEPEPDTTTKLTTTQEPETTKYITTPEPETTTLDNSPKIPCDFNGPLPYPCDCSKSLVCIDGILTVTDCPGGTLFDYKYGVCMAANLANCGII